MDSLTIMDDTVYNYPSTTILISILDVLVLISLAMAVIPVDELYVYKYVHRLLLWALQQIDDIEIGPGLGYRSMRSYGTESGI